jgi:RimJ/RimL family protein N-acetyltransferase
MQHKGTQRLLTSRLELRRLTLADAEQMFAHWAADREVTRFLTWPPHATVDVTRGVLEEWVAGYGADDFYQWGIVLNETSELVGTISVVSIDDDVDAVEVGYCLGRA